MTSTVSSAIKTRHAARAFLDKPVDDGQIYQILDLARYAPSGVNTQPWQVSVVSGETKQRLESRMLKEFDAGIRGEMQYQYYPKTWTVPYKQRRVATGKQLYGALNIAREDKEKQRQQWAANYRAFDAPVALFFWMDDVLETGSYLDYGMFLQNIMLLAIEQGLATCPQGALGEYPDIVRQTLNMPDDKILIGGMAIGYEDTNHPVNQYRTEREPVENFTQFYD
ncbi:nitroreductase [Hydrogenovibrio thermophilus]|uniref:Nitroreductase n=1 Tax=Hydrogenovibrio thermophilus TaxID=265883 RepID=A0A451G572_9GAMM|nr:nitroreductase [Hydrogenovibrio thermophilus]QAB14648.1 nitroreductase [Hydrogenovibrio thermophilus]